MKQLFQCCSHLLQKYKQWIKTALTSIITYLIFLSFPKKQQLQQTKQNEVRKLFIGLDCEMVGCGKKGLESILARCSIVSLEKEINLQSSKYEVTLVNDQEVYILYDVFVKPTKRVTDYRTKYSGVSQHTFHEGFQSKIPIVSFWHCQDTVIQFLNSNKYQVIIVGHALNNDFDALKISFPKEYIRDTSSYKLFGYGRKLKELAMEYLKLNIQNPNETTGHSSVEDAAAALLLYDLNKVQWEAKVSSNTNKEHNLCEKFNLNLYIDAANTPLVLDVHSWSLSSKQNPDWIATFQSMQSSQTLSKVNIIYDEAKFHNQDKNLASQTKVLAHSITVFFSKQGQDADDFMINQLPSSKLYTSRKVSLEEALQITTTSNYEYILIRRNSKGSSKKTHVKFLSKFLLRRLNEGVYCLPKFLFNHSCREMKQIYHYFKKNSSYLEFEARKSIKNDVVVTNDVFLRLRCVNRGVIVLSLEQFFVLTKV